ncbi:hypothetical protein NKG94_15710 [Micromonospora sp. M12]
MVTSSALWTPTTPHQPRTDGPGAAQRLDRARQAQSGSLRGGEVPQQWRHPGRTELEAELAGVAAGSRHLHVQVTADVDARLDGPGRWAPPMSSAAD